MSSGRRWAIPLALLSGEALAVSLLVDLPAEAGEQGLAGGIRLLFPVLLAALAAGAILDRPRLAAAREALPPWRPLPALAAHAVAFATVAVWAARLFGSATSPPGAAALALWVVAVMVTAFLALRSAAPVAWLWRTAAARWRLSLLALVFGLLSWRGAVAAEDLWGALSSATLHGTAALLGGAAGGVFVDSGARVIALRGFAVEIAPVCSGADGIGLVATFLAMWIAQGQRRLRVGRALLFLPLGMAAAFAANLLRVAALVWLGASGREALAVGGFHSKLGWFLFLGLALACVWVVECSPWFRRPATQPSAEPGGDPPAVAAAAPLLAALAVGLVTGLFAEGGVDLAYGARIAAAVLVLVAVRRQLPSLRPGYPVRSIAVGLLLGVGWVTAVGGGGGPAPQELLALAPAWRHAWIAVRAAGAVAVIPAVEELAFRGFLLDWLGGGAAGVGSSPSRWPWLALVLSSVAFATLHPQFLLAAVAGLAFGAVRVWRGRLVDAVVAHAACNLVLAVAALGAGRWQLWG